MRLSAAYILSERRRLSREKFVLYFLFCNQESFIQNIFFLESKFLAKTRANEKLICEQDEHQNSNLSK